MSTDFVPEGFTPPDGLIAEAFVLEPLGPEHNEADHAAWMSSIERIGASPGFADDFDDDPDPWPRPMTLEQNLSDLEQHAQDLRDRVGFTYTVLDPVDLDVIGCYLYPSPLDGVEVTEPTALANPIEVERGARLMSYPHPSEADGAWHQRGMAHRLPLRPLLRGTCRRSQNSRTSPSAEAATARSAPTVPRRDLQRPAVQADTARSWPDFQSGVGSHQDRRGMVSSAGGRSDGKSSGRPPAR